LITEHLKETQSMVVRTATTECLKAILALLTLFSKLAIPQPGSTTRKSTPTNRA
jgi:hypothetical protein